MEMDEWGDDTEWRRLPVARDTIWTVVSSACCSSVSAGGVWSGS